MLRLYVSVPLRLSATNVFATKAWGSWQRKTQTRLKLPPHLLPVLRTGAPRRAPALPPQSTSGQRTTPFAFSAWLCSSVCSASLLLLRQPSPASLLPPRGPWRSSFAERSGGTPSGGAEIRETEASAETQRDAPCAPDEQIWLAAGWICKAIQSQEGNFRCWISK